ncbi:MAG: hypothetical protein LBQ24_04605 [Candidatus Peribacteria bacterium]|jgi:hypothetical protein|nr:hypothetical protein [Candidatus Peribacteria bacterium]
MGTIGKSPEKGLEKLELQEGELMLLRRFLTVVEFDLSIKQGKSLLGRLNSLLLDK